MEIDTGPLAELMQALIEPGIRPTGSPLPANCWMVYGHKRALLEVDPGHKELLKQIPEDSSDLLKRLPKSGPLASVSGRPSDTYMVAMAGLVRPYENQVRESYQRGSFFDVDGWYSDAICEKAIRVVSEVIPKSCIAVDYVMTVDLACVVYSTLLGLEDRPECFDTFEKILRAGGVRVSWRGDFPNSGDPVVYWPWPEEPVFDSE